MDPLREHPGKRTFCIEWIVDFEADYPAIVYNDALTSNVNVPSKLPVSIYNAIKADIDFSISFFDSEDEDYTFICDKNSCSYKLIPVNDLKPEPVNDHVEIDAYIMEFEERLGKIYKRGVHRVQVLDFGGLTDEMTVGLSDMMLMEHRDLIMEFFSAFRFGEAVLGFDMVWALQFQLDGAKHRMSWREFILGMGLHTAEEMESAGGMDVWSVNIPYLLARYLRRFASGRKQEAMISRGKFVSRLAKHFGMLTEQRLQGLTVIAPDLLVIDMAELAVGAADTTVNAAGYKLQLHKRLQLLKKDIDREEINDISEKG
ncbi:hypothetical protein Tco_0525313 [Tanacetum coccineum]